MKPENPYLGAGLLCLTYLGCFFLSEALWSRTPGNYLQGLGGGTDGRPCGWRAALIRTVLRAVEANPLLFDRVPAGAAILVSKHTKRLGDLAAGTLLVSVK